MRVLFISQRVPYPPNKGEKIRTFNQIKYLCQQGHEVVIICPIENSTDKASIQSLQEVVNVQVISHKTTNKLLSYIIGIIKNQPLSIRHFFNRFLYKKTHKLPVQLFDGIICSSSSMAEYVINSKYITNIKNLIVDFMDLDSDKWLQYANHTTGIKKWIYKREYRLLAQYERKVQRHADYCVFTTAKEVELFKKLVGNQSNIKAIGNGLDTQYFQPTHKSFDKSKPCLIFTGVMDYKPNVDAVIWFCKSIWPKIITNHPNASFIIAGMKPTAEVESLAKLKNVIVTGFVEDIRGFYQQADIFVAPLRIARGVQNKVLEAFACGLPVISTSNAIQGINCQVDKHVLCADNETDFINSILKLLTDEQLRNDLRGQALTLIQQQYTWQGQLHKLDKLLKADLT